MCAAGAVLTVELRRGVTHLAHPPNRRRDAYEAPIAYAIQVREFDEAGLPGCREDLLAYQVEVTTLVTHVAVSARGSQAGAMVHNETIMLVAGGNVARGQRLPSLLLAGGNAWGMADGALEIKVACAGRGVAAELRGAVSTAPRDEQRK